MAYTIRFPSELRVASNYNPAIYNWQTNLLFPRFSGGGPRSDIVFGSEPSYFLDGFTPIQNAIAISFTKLQCDAIDCKNLSIPKIQMQRFPYPTYINDSLLSALQQAVGLLIMLSFLYSIISTVRFIAIEREKQLKEIMKLMGMPFWLHWTCWFLRTMIFMIISIIFMVVLLKVIF